MPNPKVGPPVAPEFLSQVPKAVVRALDVSEVLLKALSSIMKHPSMYGPVIALYSIDSYFDAAKLQQRRIHLTPAHDLLLPFGITLAPPYTELLNQVSGGRT